MDRRTIVIGLDCPNDHLLSQWIDKGLLPHLAGLRRESSSGVITHSKQYSNQNSWIPFLTGRSLQTIDYWISTYKPTTYENTNHCLYNLKEYAPFYAVGDAARVIMFDLPVAINGDVNGVQVVGWASELNETFSESVPARALEEIVEKYGTDPKMDGALDFYNEALGKFGRSYRVPSAYDLAGLRSFRDKLLQSTATRGQICQDFLERDDWDLFVTVFSEIHVAGHTLWHLSQQHPIAGLREHFESDPLLEIYQAVDREIGRLVERAGCDSEIVVFTLDSLVSDCLENARSLFLPEFLYRWNFPGQAALAQGDPDAAIPAPGLDYPGHWKDEVWKLRTGRGDAELESPDRQSRNNDTFNWQPTNWYKPIWHRMRAFALPSVADGYIRINVVGRESSGLVEPADFLATCDEICERLGELTDARTGGRMVERVIRVREDPFEQDAQQPPADLIVLWQEESPTDTVDGPGIGRIGPVPFFRPGGHQKQGSLIENVVMIRGAGCRPDRPFATGRLEDLPATILDRMGIPVPAHFDGRPLSRQGDTGR